MPPKRDSLSDPQSIDAVIPNEQLPLKDMFGDTQSPPKSPCPEVEEYMSFNCTELNKELVEYARIYLNETEENKKKGLEEMKEIVKNEWKGRIDMPDIFHLCYLRSRKFDVKRAFNLLKKGADFVDSHQQIFNRVDSEAVRRTVQAKIVGYLPYRDAKGRAILYIRSECWNPSEIKADDVIFGSIVALHVAAENPINQVAGFVVIVDFKNLTIQQVVGMSNWIFFGLQALQRVCPCLVKEFHVVHTPALIKATWKMIKPMISEKIRKRIIFYKSAHWDSLHRRISPRILPEELGGQLGPQSQEHWTSDLEGIEKRYYQRIDMFLNRQKQD